MKSQNNISNLFPKHLFWDVDITKLDLQRDSNFIIPRALYMTNEETFLQDIIRLENIYTANQILENLKNTKEKISNTVCHLVAKRYSSAPFYRFKPISY